MSIAAKEFPQTQGGRGVPRAHQDQIAQVVGDQGESPQDERPNDDLAEFCVSCNQRVQALRVDLKKVTGFADATEHQASLPGDHAQFAGKPAGPVRRNQALALKLRLYDFQAARKQEEERHANIVGPEHDLAALDLSYFTQWTHTADLSGRQNRKGLSTSVKSAECRQRRHLFPIISNL